MPGASRVSIGVQPPGCGSFFVGGLIDRERGEPWEPNTHVPSDAPGARMSLRVAETGGTRVSGRDNAAPRTLGTRLTGSRETSKVPSAIMRRGPFVSPRLQSDADEMANRGRGRDHAGPGLTSASLGCLARAQREPHRSSRGGECFGRFAPPMHLDGRQRARLACFFQEGPRNGRRVREGDEGDQRETIWSNRLSHPVRMGAEGVRRLAPSSEVVVIVDVLSFTTCVDVAVSRDLVVFPYPWRDDSGVAFARSVAAMLAGKRGQIPSLSPRSLCCLPPHSRLVLPSPNGSACADVVQNFQASALAGCLRNARAVSDFIKRRYAGAAVSIIACGEKMARGDTPAGH